MTGTAVETARGETLQAVQVLSLDEVIATFDGSLGLGTSRIGLESELAELYRQRLAETTGRPKPHFWPDAL